MLNHLSTLEKSQDCYDISNFCLVWTLYSSIWNSIASLADNWKVSKLKSFQPGVLQVDF